MTGNIQERNTIISRSRMTAMIGILFGVVAFGILENGIFKGNYTISTLILFAFAMLALLPIRLAKERVKVRDKAPSILQIGKTIVKNKYLMIYSLATFFWVAFMFSTNLMPYLASDVLKNSSAVIILMIIMMLPTIVVAFFIPILLKKFSKHQIFLFSLSTSIILSFVVYFGGYSNPNTFYILSLFKGIVASAPLIIGTLFFADCIEYNQFKTGHRMEAPTFAVRTFLTKLCTAFAGGMGMMLLSYYGYKSHTADQTVVQSAATIKGIFITYNLWPIVGLALCLVVFFFFYKLTDEKLAPMIEANRKQTSEENAEDELTAK